MGIEDLPNLNSFIVGAVFVGIFYYWLVWKTSLGFDLSATGLNPVAAKFSGADPNKLIVLWLTTVLRRLVDFFSYFSVFSPAVSIRFATKKYFIKTQ